MTRIEVELNKLRKTAKSIAVKHGMHDGMVSINCCSNTLHVTVWIDGNIVNSRSGVLPRTKHVKQTIEELVREYKNSQS